MEFGVAAGVLQVAGVGVHLAKTLHAAATNMRDAKKDITAIVQKYNLHLVLSRVSELNWTRTKRYVRRNYKKMFEQR